MYFVRQLYVSFSMLCFNNFDEKPGDILPNKSPERDKGTDRPATAEDVAAAKGELESNAKKMDKTLAAEHARLARLRGGIPSASSEAKVAGVEGGEKGEKLQEGKKEIQPVTTKEALLSVKPVNAEETQLAAMMGKNDATPEQIQQAIYESRLKQMASNEISDGDKKVIEATFINDIAKETGIDPKLMADMRALGFEGLQDGTPEEVAEKLRAFSGDMEKINQFAKNQGMELPKTKEEFIALYNQLKGPDGEIRVPATKEEMDAAGISIDEKGNVSYTGAGYANGERSAGLPYEQGGSVYSGQRPSVSSRNYPIDPNLDINNLPKGVEGLMDLIVLKEARGSYDTILDASRIEPPQPISTMKLDEVYAFQKKMITEQRARGINPPSSAVGGLQIVSGTLKGLVDKGVVSMGDTFNKETQRKMMLALLQEDGLEGYKSGSVSKEEFMSNIAGTWASFPKNMSGSGAYDGYAGNHAYVNAGQVSEILDQIKQG